MSLSFIDDFQKYMYEVLISKKYISENIKHIYFGAVQDGKDPFLLLNISKIEKLSYNTKPIYSVEFQISAFAKDHNHRLLICIAEHVIEAIENCNKIFSKKNIIGIKSQDMKFDKAKDLVLNKVMINYKASIKICE